jgi:hypothetical protein
MHQFEATLHHLSNFVRRLESLEDDLDHRAPISGSRAVGLTAMRTSARIPLTTAPWYLVSPAGLPGRWDESPTRRRVWQIVARDSTNSTAFERTSKRRKGYPSEPRVKRGSRVVHGEKELLEKLGRNDLCPCGSGRRFQALLPWQRPL